jgi:cytochrome c oxidase subunit 2
MNGMKRFCIVVLALTIGMIAGYATVNAGDEPEKVIKITAKKFEYNPNRIILKKGVAVTLEFTSLDRLHGFNCPDFSLRTDILPGKVSRITFTPDKTGTFPFHCDNFCGEGHENMTGEFEVTE